MGVNLRGFLTADLPKTAMRGPAYLDVDKGIAHRSESCPSYEDASASAEACDGPLVGFTWCQACAATGSGGVPCPVCSPAGPCETHWVSK
jgi:hypothetical protein